MSNIVIVGFDSTIKVPGFYAETVYGAGALTAGDIPLTLLVVGTQLSSGTATPDQDVKDIFSTNDADTFYGAGSQIARMCYQALRYPGIRLKGAAVAEAGGAVAATATITITGTWTTSGNFSYRIDGTPISGSISSTDTIQNVANAIAAAVTGNPQLPVTAAVGAGPGYVVTLTRKSKGATGNQGILFQDTSSLPSGMTSTIAGGSSVTGPGVFFGSGSGTENVTTLLAVLFSQTYARIAFAQNDSGNCARWVTQLNSQAGVLQGRLQHAVTAVNGSLSAATTLSTASLNAERVELCWYLYSESHPSELAASMAALRTVSEQVDPSAYYDGHALTGIAPQSQASDWPSFSTQVSALDNGITPIATTPEGDAVVVRAITSKSLTNGNPDYRTLDTYQAVVPDFVRTGLGLYWISVFRPANPKVNADPAPEQRARPAGVATPSLWNSEVFNLMTNWESLLYVTNVADNPPTSEFDPVAKRIMSIVPVVPAFAQHQLGVSVRQVG